MSKDSKTRSTPAKGQAKEPANLGAVLFALEQNSKLGATRIRDLRSAVKRVSALVGAEPAAVRLDLPEISARLGAINPVAVGMTAKRFTNKRDALRLNAGFDFRLRLSLRRPSMSCTPPRSEVSSATPR